jgi:hypothetical protein
MTATAVDLSLLVSAVDLGLKRSAVLACHQYQRTKADRSPGSPTSVKLFSALETNDTTTIDTLLADDVVWNAPELLGVTKQRAHPAGHAPGFPAPVERDGRARLWSRREVTCVGEGLASREALAPGLVPGRFLTRQRAGSLLGGQARRSGG